MFLLNAFSINMLPAGYTKVHFTDVGLGQAVNLLSDGFVSAVGHADTAAVFSSLLGMPVLASRKSVTIPERGFGVSAWVALVGQYSGPRLPEGATALPEGASIRWVAVHVE